MQLIMTRWSCQVEAENRHLAAQFVSVLPCAKYSELEHRPQQLKKKHITGSDNRSSEEDGIVQRTQKGQTAASKLQRY